MKRLLTSILIVLFGVFASYISYTFAVQVDLSPADTVRDASIIVNATGNDVTTLGQSFGMRILWLMKLVVSGFALVFMVMIGVYMVVFSENEERVKTQRKQIVYALVAFLFLNIPGVVYEVIAPGSASGESASAWNWNDSESVWFSAWLQNLLWDLIPFFRIFAYGVAVMMFTWGFFRLIVSSGDEERVKSAKSRVIYSSLALIFMLFLELWVQVISRGDFGNGVGSVAWQAFRLAFFFAGPIAVFFIIYGAYYYITSAWDEERIKKWKAILVNTFIASLILIAAFTFLRDLLNFSF
jgi:hypothetical protein